LKDLLKSILKGTVQLPVKSSVMQYEQDALTYIILYEARQLISNCMCDE